MALPCSFDTETFLIRPGRLAPPMVCLTSSIPATGGRLYHARPEMMPEGPIWGNVRPPRTNPHDTSAEAHFDWVLDQDPIVGVNIAYDMCVCLALWPWKFAKVFQAYREGRVIDLALAMRLYDNAHGMMDVYNNREPNGYSMEGLNLRLLKKRTTGKHEGNAWRFRYEELYPVPLPEWPEAAVQYAIGDADDGLAILNAFTPEMRSYMFNAPAQSRAAFALQLMMCWGVITDRQRIEMLQEVAEEMFWKLSDKLTQVPPCIEHNDTECKECFEREPLVRGITNPNTGKDYPPKQRHTRNTRAAQERMLRYCAHHDLPLKLTKTGYSEYRDLTGGKPGVDVWDVFDHAQLVKYSSVDEDACKESGDEVLQMYSKRTQLDGIVHTHVPDLLKGTFTPLQPRYNTFVESGRTSCSKGKKKKGDKSNRPAPTNGMQFQNPKKALKDFPPGVGIRECVIARTGMLFADNDFSGLELHTGAEACHQTVGYSMLGEALNAGRDPHLQFGAKLMGISYEEAKARKHEPEVRKFRGYAKPANFGLPGGLGTRGLMKFAHGYGVKLTFTEADDLKKAWFEEFPEWVDYFKFIRNHIDYASGLGQIEQLFVNRIRGGVTYTSACNSLFQGLGADGAKEAMFEVAYRCYTPEAASVLYGARPCGFVHDEILAEVFEALAHEQAFEMAQVMVDACNKFLPHYPVRCEPALCKRWTKEAEAVFDRSGRLQPYDLAKEGNWESYYDQKASERVNWRKT
jgi:DNA polymerase-1